MYTERNSAGSAWDANGVKPVSRLEIAVSIFIGMLLLSVSCLVFNKVMTPQAIVIRNPLLSGIIFIVFSIGSFLVSSFETQVGKHQASLGLVSDGMHAKADMFASLLTGFSLILYAMGINVDKWMAAAIGVILFCLAMDTFVNAYRVYRDKNGDALHSYRFLSAFLSVFTLKNLNRLPVGHHWVVSKRTYKILITVSLGVLLMLYASTVFLYGICKPSSCC